MNALTFSWDDRKERENRRKHGVSFEEAITVFADENARLKHDPDHSGKEDRFILLGFSAKLRMLVVVHAYRQDENEIRLIFRRVKPLETSVNSTDNYYEKRIRLFGFC